MLLTLLALSVGPPAGCFTPVWRSIDSLRTRADSMALGEQLLVHPPLNKGSCGKLLGGFLLGLTSTEAEDTWQQRTRAMELLDQGLLDNEEEPRLYFAQGITYFWGQRHVDGERLLHRALELEGNARPAFTNKELALLHFVLGEVKENSWRDFRSLGEFKSASEGMFHCTNNTGDLQLGGNSTGLEEFFFLCSDKWEEIMRTAWRDLHEMRRDTYHEMVDEYQAALKADPTYLPAAMALLGEYAYERDFEKSYDLVRRTLRALPADPDVLAAAGAVYHFTGRDSLAQRTFARALELMDPRTRAVYEDIRPLLSPDDSARFVSTDTARAARAREAFWHSVDPLYITPLNERRLEHYARVAIVDELFGVPTLGQRGWDTDGGQIWIRYGRPRDMREIGFGEGGIRSVFWTYDTHGLRFAFTRGLTFRRYRFAETSQMHERELKHEQAQKGDPELIDSATALDRQIVRIMGADSLPQVLVYAPWPGNFGDGTLTGLTLMDQDFTTVAQWRGGRLNPDGVGAVLNKVPPGRFALALEMWDPAYKRLAHTRDTLTVRSFAGGLNLSDILLATRIRSPSGQPPRSRADLAITPNFGITLPARAPVGLYWEIYGLTPDSTGVRRYDVTIELKHAGDDLPTRVLRGLAGILGGNRSSTVRYQGTALTPRGIEWLELEAPAQRGGYTVHLTVTDRVTGAVSTTDRSFIVQ
ncbi:MAG TPA: GWxTD domain-containing protein [Gemmatimonadales bacterium]